MITEMAKFQVDAGGTIARVVSLAFLLTEKRLYVENCWRHLGVIEVRMMLHVWREWHVSQGYVRDWELPAVWERVQDAQ